MKYICFDSDQSAVVVKQLVSQLLQSCYSDLFAIYVCLSILCFATKNHNQSCIFVFVRSLPLWLELNGLFLYLSRVAKPSLSPLEKLRSLKTKQKIHV